MKGFQMDLNLQSLAAISFASLFVKNFSDNAVFNSIVDELENSWNPEFIVIESENYLKLIRNVIKKLKEINLPQIILDEIGYAVHQILKRSIEWYKNMKSWFGFRYIDLKKLYWTCYGTVDTEKVVREEWTKWFDANGELKKDYVTYFDSDPDYNAKFAMYYMACVCILTDYIESHDDKMLDFWKNRRELQRMADQDTFFYCSMSFLTDSKRKQESCSKMFFQAYSRGYDIAALYYLKLLKPADEDEHLVPAALRCSLHEDENYSKDLMAFLILEMSDDQKQNFFFHQEQYGVFTEVRELLLLLIDWPWEDLFLKIFQDIKMKLLKLDCAYLLEKITYKMAFVKHELGCDFKNTVYWKMFIVVFDEIRRHSLSGNLPLIPEYSDGFEFVYLFDFQVLKLVLELECENDQSRKSCLTPAYDNIFGKLVRNNEFDVIDEFMEVILKSRDEKEWFKKYSEWHKDFVIKCEYQNLDKLLDWQCESTEERKSMKLNAVLRGNLLCVCGKLFAEEKLSEAEEAKKWGLPNNEDLKWYAENYKKTHDLGWLYEIWMKSLEEPLNFESCIEKAKDRTTEFLKWFLGTDNNVAVFKDEKLIDETKYFYEEFGSSLCSFSKKIPVCKTFIELLKFCFSSEHLSRFKEMVSNDIHDWLLNNYITNAICDANTWMDFLFQDDVKKKEAIQSFLLSADRYAFFSWIFSSDTDNTVVESMSEWLALWVKMAVDENGIDDYFNDLLSNASFDQKSKENLNSLRSVLNKNSLKN